MNFPVANFRSFSFGERDTGGSVRRFLFARHATVVKLLYQPLFCIAFVPLFCIAFVPQVITCSPVIVCALPSTALAVELKKQIPAGGED